MQNIFNAKATLVVFLVLSVTTTAAGQRAGFPVRDPVRLGDPTWSTHRQGTGTDDLSRNEPGQLIASAGRTVNDWAVEAVQYDPTAPARLPPTTPYLANVPPPYGEPLTLNGPMGSVLTDRNGCASNFADPEAPWLPPPDTAWAEEQKISDYKSGFFQKLSFRGTWLDRNGVGGLGITELESLVTVGVPFPTRNSPLLITSGFNARLLDGPIAPELPSQLYDAYMEFRWLHKRDWGGMEFGVTPGLYSDFEQNSDEALRIKGRAGTLYEWRPDLKVVVGILYLDRRDINWLPVGGVIYTPTPDTRYELIFPRTKVGWRFAYDCVHLVEDWLYVGAEFAGDEWVFERTTGALDTMTMRDIRVRVGVERKRDGGGGHHLEVGYVLARELEFTSGVPQYEPDGTFMVRGGWAF